MDVGARILVLFDLVGCRGGSGAGVRARILRVVGCKDGSRYVEGCWGFPFLKKCIGFVVYWFLGSWFFVSWFLGLLVSWFLDF